MVFFCQCFYKTKKHFNFAIQALLPNSRVNATFANKRIDVEYVIGDNEENDEGDTNE